MNLEKKNIFRTLKYKGKSLTNCSKKELMDCVLELTYKLTELSLKQKGKDVQQKKS